MAGKEKDKPRNYDTLKGLPTTLTTQNIFNSSFEELFFNQLQKSTTNIQKQMVQSAWRGRSGTLKIEEEGCKRMRQMKPA